MKKIVLQKFIANSGLCSRRKAEDLIKRDKVIINGKQAKLGDRVNESDKVFINGKKIIKDNSLLYIKLNKPVGYVCSNRSFPEEKSVFELVKLKKKLVCAGRLDKNSRGLVLLTNDGVFVNKITHPSFDNEKEYLVRVRSKANEKINNANIIKELMNGIKSDGELLNAKKVEVLNENFFKIILTYGKKRHIRRMFKALDLHVQDLIRVRVGDIVLGNLKEGEWEYFKK